MHIRMLWGWDLNLLEQLVIICNNNIVHIFIVFGLFVLVI